MSGGILLTIPGGGSVTFPTDTAPATLREYFSALGTGSPRAKVETPYLDAGEAAAYLRFPRKRIYHLTSRGDIPHRKQDGRLLFRRDELDHWMDGFYAGPRRTGPD